MIITGNQKTVARWTPEFARRHLTKPVIGLVDRKGGTLPAGWYQTDGSRGALSGMVVEFNWAAIQAGNTPFPALSGSGKKAIEDAITFSDSSGIKLKLRIYTGGEGQCPPWVLNMAGTLVAGEEGKDIIAPKFWTQAYRDALYDLHSKVAELYDDGSINEVSVGGSNPTYNEPFLIRGIQKNASGADNKYSYYQAGLNGADFPGTGSGTTLAKTKVQNHHVWAISRLVDVFADAWKNAYLSLSVNPLDSPGPPSNPGALTGLSNVDGASPGGPTDRIIDYFLNRVGERALLANNSFGWDLTPGNGNSFYTVDWNIGCSATSGVANITSSRHPFVDGLAVSPVTNAAGLSSTTTYYVRNVATNTFQLFTGPGSTGTVVTPSANGTFDVEPVVTNPAPSGGNYGNMYELMESKKAPLYIQTAGTMEEKLNNLDAIVDHLSRRPYYFNVELPSQYQFPYPHKIKSGTAATSTVSTLVVSDAGLFSTGVAVGDVLFNRANNQIAIIQAINSATSVAVTPNWNTAPAAGHKIDVFSLSERISAPIASISGNTVTVAAGTNIFTGTSKPVGSTLRLEDGQERVIVGRNSDVQAVLDRPFDGTGLTGKWVSRLNKSFAGGNAGTGGVPRAKTLNNTMNNKF